MVLTAFKNTIKKNQLKKHKFHYHIVFRFYSGCYMPRDACSRWTVGTCILILYYIHVRCISESSTHGEEADDDGDVTGIGLPVLLMISADGRHDEPWSAEVTPAPPWCV